MTIAGFRNNDQGCLSNTVLQACTRQRIQVAHAASQEMRILIEDAEIPLEQVDQVVLHQCPKRGGFVEFTVTVHAHSTDGCVVKERKFQGSSLSAAHESFSLYSKERDGKVEFLHLSH